MFKFCVEVISVFTYVYYFGAAKINVCLLGVLVTIVKVYFLSVKCSFEYLNSFRFVK